MKNKVFFILVSLLIGSILVACGPSQPELDTQATEIVANPSATQIAEAPTLTPTSTLTPILPTATATSTKVPPTATSTDTPEPTTTPTPAIINPQPGSTFTGVMEVSQPGSDATAKGGILEFTVTNDGNAIASISISFMESKCSVTSEGVTSVIESGSFYHKF